METRSDLALATTVMTATALVLAAPVLGRTGHPAAADLAMAAAAACGFGSFALAGLATWRAARRRDAAARPSGESS